jgi:hypothetical protein
MDVPGQDRCSRGLDDASESLPLIEKSSASVDLHLFFRLYRWAMVTDQTLLVEERLSVPQITPARGASSVPAPLSGPAEIFEHRPYTRLWDRDPSLLREDSVCCREVSGVCFTARQERLFTQESLPPLLVNGPALPPR